MFGWVNPFPQKTGGRSRVYRIYQELRKGVGDGGSGPAGGIEDLWDRAVARAISASQSAVEHAAFQRWSHTMSSAMSRWEKHFGLARGATLVERQAAIRRAFIEVPDATYPGLAASLRAIDVNFAIEQLPWVHASQVDFGRTFGPLPGAPGGAFGTGAAAGRISTKLANVADPFTVFVRYLLPVGVTEIPPASVAAAAELLNTVLPTWQDWDIYNLTLGAEGAGFYLDGGDDDTSRLDQTAFG